MRNATFFAALVTAAICVMAPAQAAIVHINIPTVRVPPPNAGPWIKLDAFQMGAAHSGTSSGSFAAPVRPKGRSR
jgi:hypothetical protein